MPILDNDLNKFVLLDVPYIGSEYACSAKEFNYNRFHKNIADKLINADYPFLYYCRSMPPKTYNPYNEQDAIYSKNEISTINKGFYFEKVYLKEDTELIISNRQYFNNQFQWNSTKPDLT